MHLLKVLPPGPRGMVLLVFAHASTTTWLFHNHLLIFQIAYIFILGTNLMNIVLQFGLGLMLLITMIDTV